MNLAIGPVKLEATAVVELKFHSAEHASGSVKATIGNPVVVKGFDVQNIKLEAFVVYDAVGGSSASGFITGDVEKSGHVLDVGFFFDTVDGGSVDVALTYTQVNRLLTDYAHRVNCNV